MRYKKPVIKKVFIDNFPDFGQGLYYYTCSSASASGEGDSLWAAWDDWHISLMDEEEFNYWLELETSLFWRN